jgi:hypothetical protein
MTDYVVILLRRYAGKEWWISGNDYSTLEWFSSGTKPSKATLDGLWASVQQEIADEAIAKASAREALLTRLGITADEAQLLLGA